MMPLRSFACLCLSLFLLLPSPLHAYPQEHKSKKEPVQVGANFKTENLVAWCIVPFDAKQRGPKARAKMVRDLGLKRVAYDWREKHVPEFESEILAYKQQGIEYFAFWDWHDAMEPLIKKHGIRPQIWAMFRGKLTGKTDSEKLQEVVQQMLPKAQKAQSLGLTFGIYNHGGWPGKPENLLGVCQELRKKHGLKNVGIVYNFHHGHEDIPTFGNAIEKLLPHLLCVNINGMVQASSIKPKTKTNKILPVGTGDFEHQMLKQLVAAGYEGPIGVLGHRNELDAKEAVQLNLDGLRKITKVKE